MCFYRHPVVVRVLNFIVGTKVDTFFFPRRKIINLSFKELKKKKPTTIRFMFKRVPHFSVQTRWALKATKHLLGTFLIVYVFLTYIPTFPIVFFRRNNNNATIF